MRDPTAEINLQWKGTDACYDFYCPCNPHEPQHRDGIFQQWFTCGERPAADGSDLDESLVYCGKTWWLPNKIIAVEVPSKGIWPKADPDA